MLQDKQAKGKKGQQAELNRPAKGAASGYRKARRKTGCPPSGLGSCGVAWRLQRASARHSFKALLGSDGESTV
jgi:hypothetical protein